MKSFSFHLCQDKTQIWWILNYFYQLIRTLDIVFQCMPFVHPHKSQGSYQLVYSFSPCLRLSATSEQHGWWCLALYYLLRTSQSASAWPTCIYVGAVECGSWWDVKIQLQLWKVWDMRPTLKVGILVWVVYKESQDTREIYWKWQSIASKRNQRTTSSLHCHVLTWERTEAWWQALDTRTLLLTARILG